MIPALKAWGAMRELAVRSLDGTVLDWQPERYEQHICQ